MSHFLDYTGLQELWTKIKQWIAARFVDKTGDTMTGDLRAPAYYVGDTVNKTTSVTTDTDGTMFLESFVQGPHDETTYGSIIRLKADEINPHYRHHMNGQWGPWKKILVEDDAAAYLPLTGGTLTGALTATTASQYIQVPGVDVSLADNGVTSNQYPGWKFRDVANRQYGIFESAVYANGNVRATVASHNYGTGSDVGNYIHLDTRNDGTRVVYLADAAAWRTALGLTKYVDKTLTTNSYGNINLGLSINNVIVLAVKSSNFSYNLIPFINATTWYAYAVKNQAGTSLTLAGSSVAISVRIYYMDI